MTPTEITRLVARHVPGLPDLEPVVSLAPDVTLPGLRTGGQAAFGWWRHLTDAAAATGQWPVLMEAELAASLPSGIDYDPDRWLAGAETIDGQGRLAELGRRRLEIYSTGLVAEIQAELRGAAAWPEDPDRHPLAEFEPDGDVVLALLPAAANWQIPALLGRRGWNEYPNPDEHSAILRYWHVRHGAELIFMASDSAEIAVARPPATHAEALALAWEYMVYNDGAYDLYGADGVTDVAASLLDADRWRAWWD